LTRTYRQSDPNSRAFGIGTNFDYDIFMVGTNNTNPNQGYLWQDMILPDGGRIHFQRISPCTGANGYCNFGDAVYENTIGPSDFQGAILKWQQCLNPDPYNVLGAWLLTKKDGTQFCFADSDASTDFRSAAPIWMKDRYGNM